MGAGSLVFLVCFALSGVVSAAGSELAGVWTLSIDTPRGIQHPTLVINKDGDSYSGVYNSLRGPLPIEKVTGDGDNFEFPLVITVPIGEVEVHYRGSISGDDMKGTVVSARGEVLFSAKRDKP